MKNKIIAIFVIITLCFTFQPKRSEAVILAVAPLLIAGAVLLAAGVSYYFMNENAQATADFVSHSVAREVDGVWQKYQAGMTTAAFLARVAAKTGLATLKEQLSIAVETSLGVTASVYSSWQEYGQAVNIDGIYNPQNYYRIGGQLYSLVTGSASSTATGDTWDAESGVPAPPPTTVVTYNPATGTVSGQTTAVDMSDYSSYPHMKVKVYTSTDTATNETSNAQPDVVQGVVSLPAVQSDVRAVISDGAGAVSVRDTGTVNNFATANVVSTTTTTTTINNPVVETYPTLTAVVPGAINWQPLINAKDSLLTKVPFSLVPFVSGLVTSMVIESPVTPEFNIQFPWGIEWQFNLSAWDTWAAIFRALILAGIFVTFTFYAVRWFI